MDHILENEGNPIPDPNTVTETSNARPSQPMDEDDEDDLAALQNLGVKGAAAAAAANATEAEAKVCDPFSMNGSPLFTLYQLYRVSNARSVVRSSRTLH
jgi:hypothetical protein